MKTKNKLVLLTSVALGLSATTIVASVQTLNATCKRPKKDHSKYRKETPIEDINFCENAPFEHINITSFDGLNLHALFLRSKQPSKKYVICVHGYHSTNLREYSYCLKFYHEQGFNILLPDQRSHGTSEGSIIGFGWLERIDVVQWIHHLLSKEDDIKIVLHGTSMGCASVLMASGEKLPEQVKCIIADCGFNSAAKEMKHVASSYNPILGIFTPVILSFSKAVLGYDLNKADTVKQIKKSKTPTLFIHGDQDDFVPTDMVYDLYDACKAEKDLLIVEGAGHARSMLVKPELCQNRIIEFTNQYMK